MTDLDVALPVGLSDLLRSLPPEDRLDVFDDVAEQDSRDNRPPHTQRAYAESWAKWQKFCAGVGVEPLTARSGLFYLFVTWLERAELAPATIERHLAAVITSLRDRDVLLPKKGGPAHKAWDEIKAYERRLRQTNVQRGRGQAAALTPDHIRRCCAATTDDLYGLRRKAILLLGAHFASRRSEVAALDGCDVAVDPAGRGLELTVRDSKGGKSRVVPIPYGQDPLTCPVLAWFAWKTAAGITEDGPAFCQIRSRGSLPPVAAPAKRLTGQTVGTDITTIGRQAGLEIHTTGHSVRAAFITIALENGADVGDVCDISGHSKKSGVVYDYKRTVDRWRNGAITGVRF